LTSLLKELSISLFYWSGQSSAKFLFCCNNLHSTAQTLHYPNLWEVL
jgi:hypothetical protein